MKTEFLDRFPKNIQIWNVIKYRTLGEELFRADGRTDKHGQVNICFSQLREDVW